MKHITIKLPAQIQFEEIPQYIKAINEAALSGTVKIDLSETVWIHSSFLGFLINLKRRINEQGGKMSLTLSKPVEKIFALTDLQHYFSREIAEGNNLSQSA